MKTGTEIVYGAIGIVAALGIVCGALKIADIMLYVRYDQQTENSKINSCVSAGGWPKTYFFEQEGKFIKRILWCDTPDPKHL